MSYPPTAPHPLRPTDELKDYGLRRGIHKRRLAHVVWLVFPRTGFEIVADFSGTCHLFQAAASNLVLAVRSVTFYMSCPSDGAPNSPES